MTDSQLVIGSPGHVINPLQKRVMTKQVAVIASEAKKSRETDSVRINGFVIIRPKHVINPAQKSVITKQVDVIANCEAGSRKQSGEPDSV